MKVDKEFLLKHHFWILAGLVLPLELFAFIWLSTSVAGDNDKARDTIKKAQDSLKSSSVDVKNDHFLAALDKKDKKVSIQKSDVWAKAWGAENKTDEKTGAYQGIFTWPGLEGREGKLYAATFGDPIDSETCSVFERKYSDYARQTFEPLIAPTQYGGGDGTWRGLVRHVPEWTQRPPDAEDLWLSMEDLWVQRELLKVVAATNEVAARFVEIKPAAGEKLPEGTKSFQNPYWRMDLTLQRGQLHGKITNISTRRQNLSAIFLIQIHQDGGVVKIPVNYKPRAVGEFREFDQDIRERNPTGVYGVSQQLDAQSVPVKRVEDLRLTYNSDRTSTRSPRPRPMQPPAGGAPAPSEGDKSRNGLERNRYIDVTPQVRRMPVAMVVLIDENFVQDLLRAFANSRLRTQTTQMHWRHVDDSRPAQAAGNLLGGAAAPPPGADEEESALVELSVYGIVSLYERPK